MEAICRLCDTMQLRSVEEDVAALRKTHRKIRSLPPSSHRESLLYRENEMMERMCASISAAFTPSSKDETKESEGLNTVTEEVVTPMELLSLVIWQSRRKEGNEAANQCLQLLQDQLGVATDRATLLDWLANVRTFTSKDSTGQLLMDPNNQWVTSNIHTAPLRQRSTPPALLITASAINLNHREDHSMAVQYHLLQLVDQPPDSPLHSHYLPSLSHLVLSPMLPFVNENAFIQRAGRQFFLPVLIHQSINNSHTPSALFTSTSTSASSTASMSSSSQSVLPLHWRCGDVVQIPPRAVHSTG